MGRRIFTTALSFYVIRCIQFRLNYHAAIALRLLLKIECSATAVRRHTQLLYPLSQLSLSWVVQFT
jgi:hypothetical protein